MGDKLISDQKIIDDSRMFTNIWGKRFKIEWKYREELQQEIAVALLEARERFDPKKANWSTYSSLRSRGAAIDYLRKCIPYSERNLLILDAPIRNRGSDEQGTDQMLDYFMSHHDDKTKLEVEELLEGISERYKKIILWLVSGYQQKEIAKKLGLSEDRVWELTKTIRQNLDAENKKYLN